jgi:thiol-disulfide isomerase/thioredoxin
MKKYRFFTAIVFVIWACSATAQVNIRIDLANTNTFDSVFVKSAAKLQSKQKLSAPFGPSVTLQDKESLKPGMYEILGDSTLLGAILVSNEKNQKFSLKIDGKKVTFQNSKENTAYYDYLEGLKAYDKQLDSLNALFEEAQKSMPQYMLKVFVDSLSASARRINDDMRAYQRRSAAAYPNTLVGSVIATSMYLSDPPQEIVGNRRLFQEYYIEHFFDNFAWNDPRIFNTPVVEQKLKEYCNMIYQLDNPDFDKYVVSALDKAKVNQTSFEYLFDALEYVLGRIISPYKVEHTYIAMLKDALTYPKLDENRQRRYTRELGFINKNLNGDTIPNFTMVMANGDTMTMYDIQSEYTILYLQHPTCPTCHQVRNRMKEFAKLNQAIESGRLKVVMVYFEDDPQVWSNYVNSREANPKYLHGWNFDQSIADNNLFDTRTIPYMFLLDKDKKVIKKDLLYNEIEPYIEYLRIN